MIKNRIFSKNLKIVALDYFGEFTSKFIKAVDLVFINLPIWSLGLKEGLKKSKKIVYGMPYDEWKKKYQKEATKEQLDKFNAKKK